jgi:hypothetical protein
MKCDELIFARLRSCSAVEAASSEEQPDIIDMPGKGYTVSRTPRPCLGWYSDTMLLCLIMQPKPPTTYLGFPSKSCLPMDGIPHTAGGI